MVQLSHLYMTTGKTIALTIRTFVSKVMSLLFNTLSRFVSASLPRSKHFRFEKLKVSVVALESGRRRFVPDEVERKAGAGPIWPGGSCW